MPPAAPRPQLTAASRLVASVTAPTACWGARTYVSNAVDNCGRARAGQFARKMATPGGREATNTRTCSGYLQRNPEISPTKKKPRNFVLVGKCNTFLIRFQRHAIGQMTQERPVDRDREPCLPTRVPLQNPHRNLNNQ